MTFGTIGGEDTQNIAVKLVAFTGRFSLLSTRIDAMTFIVGIQRYKYAALLLKAPTSKSENKHRVKSYVIRVNNNEIIANLSGLLYKPSQKITQ